MLAFLETGLKLDASGLTIGGSSNNTLTATLTIDQRSASVALNSFTASVPNNEDTTVPYSLSITKVNSNVCTLTVTFNQPLANVHFGETRTITITGSNADTYTLSLEINYANNLSTNYWTNSTESASIDDIDLRGPLTSISINNRLRALLNTSLTALNQVKNFIKYYGYKEKYLTDIVDFALATGMGLEPSTSTITYNSDGNITSIITNYQTGRTRAEKIKITYTYGNYALNRLSGANTNVILATDTVSLLNTLKVDAIDVSGNVIYTLGTVSINRSGTPSMYGISYLKDYNSLLPAEQLSTDVDNILSNYKYYQTYTITGWTVVA